MLHEKPMPTEVWLKEPVYGFDPEYDPCPSDTSPAPESPPLEQDPEIPF